MGIQIVSDKLPEKEKINRINPKIVFKLWLRCCRQENVLTLEEMISFQPHLEERLRTYDQFVDKEGKTTLNPFEYKQYKKKQREMLEQKRKIVQAKKGSKLKM